MDHTSRILARDMSRKNENKEYLAYLYTLAMAFLFYGKDPLYDLVVIFAYLWVCFRVHTFEMFCSTYFLLIYFEPILDMPFISGSSMFIVFQLVLLMRYLHQFGWQLQLRRETWLIYLVMAVRAFSAFACGDGVKPVLSILINFTVILLIISKARNHSYIFAAIAIGAVASGLYGVINSVTMRYQSFSRFSGVIGDPNYSAYQYTVAVFAVLGCKLFSSRIKLLLMGMLLACLALTVSMSGIVFLALLLFVYVLAKRSSLGVFAFGSAGIAGIVFLLLPIGSGPLRGIHSRLNTMLLNALRANWDAVTTHRTSIADAYLQYFSENSTVFQLLFGGQNVLNGAMRDDIVARIGYVSHNSYIDCMFFCGIIGCGLIVAGIAIRAVQQFRKYKKTGDEEALSLAMIKCTVLLYMAVLSLFPYRYWYGFILL